MSSRTALVGHGHILPLLLSSPPSTLFKHVVREALRPENSTQVFVDKLAQELRHEPHRQPGQNRSHNHASIITAASA